MALSGANILVTLDSLLSPTRTHTHTLTIGLVLLHAQRSTIYGLLAFGQEQLPLQQS